MRSFYSANISEFLNQKNEEILGTIYHNSASSDVTIQQENAWEAEISILKNELSALNSDGRIIFEYTIPRMGKRVDTIILYENIVFILEFKVGDSEYRRSAYDQVFDYALDLQNFQKESHDKLLIPIIVSTDAEEKENRTISHGNILEPLYCNSGNIATTIILASQTYKQPHFDYYRWEQSEYLPTPTIIEAAQALYQGHEVQDITRSDAGAENLTVTTAEINDIIEHSKNNHRKSIIFVTGVPGAGKTLVGLNLAIQYTNAKEGEHAVFLSGNFPLVTVLQEALARDSVKNGTSKSKTEALRKTTSFIQIVHRYRDSFVGNDSLPPERIAIFDEAQRAWTKEMICSFMRTKKGVFDFNHSEPEFLISTMDRHEDWSVIICLVGGGQEINTGEAGLPEWFDSLRSRFSGWDVYVAPQLNDTEYRRDRSWKNMIADLPVTEKPNLHLSTSVRSFRTPHLSAFIKALLDIDIENARDLYSKIKDNYPIRIARDITIAKNWIREQCLGTTRYGMLASSGGLRLKADGIFVKNNIDVAEWFLDGKDDIRSSYYLEDTVTEFDIQGLELDYSLVCWDADFRFNGEDWEYYSFRGNRWTNVTKEERKLYLKNSYRVLLTRARQGMVIYIPRGDDLDKTRKPSFYNETYNLLKDLGVTEI
ncbi:DUF2075 domain-containing protein [Candidatus Saccharibacteria bacterium]|nr:DUF2075 domain-containing protein [Candidatus Saccharibacteria bacterium]